MSQPIPPPTSDDLARDLTADLAVCEEATPEVWCVKMADMVFITIACTALPAYIRRCAAAEAEVDRLRKRVQELEREVSRLEDHLQ